MMGLLDSSLGPKSSACPTYSFVYEKVAGKDTYCWGKASEFVCLVGFFPTETFRISNPKSFLEFMAKKSRWGKKQAPSSLS